MAGDWLKVEKSLPEKPEVWQMAGILDLDPDAVVGKLIRVFSWFDEHTENGNAPSVTEKLLDRLVGVTGFTQALRETGWLFTQGDEIALRNFTRHNGKTAKTRASGQKRQEKYRNDKVTVKASLEKRREENSNNKKNTKKNSPRKTHDGFEKFYAEYPRKSNRQAAEQAWNKLSPSDDLQVTITQDIENRVSSGHWDLSAKDYIPHPSTYLNQKRWTDEITPRGNSHAQNRPGANPATPGRKLTPAERTAAKREQLRQSQSSDMGTVATDGRDIRPPVGLPAR